MPPHDAPAFLSCFGTDAATLISSPCLYDSSSEAIEHRRKAQSSSSSRLHPPSAVDSSPTFVNKRPPLAIRAIRSFTSPSSFRKGKQPIRSASESSLPLGNPFVASSSAPHLPLPPSAISVLRRRNPSESSLVVDISYKQGTSYARSGLLLDCLRTEHQLTSDFACLRTIHVVRWADPSTPNSLPTPSTISPRVSPTETMSSFRPNPNAAGNAQPSPSLGPQPRYQKHEDIPLPSSFYTTSWYTSEQTVSALPVGASSLLLLHHEVSPPMLTPASWCPSTQLR
jgi:hypothetical protein